MRFHALLPVRDEADIIQQCLEQLLTWADGVYVFDTGSVDATWDIVQAIARQDKRIVPVAQDGVYFSETRLRGYLFHWARERMEHGDWFLRVDADEFHHIPPPDFVKTHVRPHETIVYHQYYDFQLTQAEVTAWEQTENPLQERDRPIEERRRYFKPSHYSEPRLCRYRRTMQWPITCSFPINAGFLARERLPIRHYPHRDPVQLHRRCLLRAIMMADVTNRQNWAQPEQHHWSVGDWRQFIVSSDDPDLQYWEPGTQLPTYSLTNHLRPPHIRIVQRLVHQFCLPILDRTRPRFPSNGYPQPIPPEVIDQLQHALSTSQST